MKKLFALALTAATLTGCGAGVGPLGAHVRSGAVTAQSLAGVNKVFKGVLEAAFKAADVNEDGRLTIDEIPVAVPTLPGQTAAAAPADPDAARKALMAQMDVNLDGKVTYREFARPDMVNNATVMFRLKAGEIFIKLDRNADRSLVAAELAAAAGTDTLPVNLDFDGLDKNGNSRITLSEFEDGLAAALVAPPDPVEPTEPAQPAKPTEPVQPAEPPVLPTP